MQTPGDPALPCPWPPGPTSDLPGSRRSGSQGGLPPARGPAPRQAKGQIVKHCASYQRLLKTSNRPTCLSRVPGRKRGGGRAVAMSSMTPASSLTLDQPAFSGPSQGTRPSFSISFTPWLLPAVRGWVENWAPKSRRGGRGCRCLRLMPPLTRRVTQTP